MSEDDVFFDAPESPLHRDQDTFVSKRPLDFAQSVVVGDVASKWKTLPPTKDINVPTPEQPAILVTDLSLPDLGNIDERRATVLPIVTMSTHLEQLKINDNKDRRKSDKGIKYTNGVQSDSPQTSPRKGDVEAPKTSPRRAVSGSFGNTNTMIKNLDNGQLISPEELDFHQTKTGLNDLSTSIKNNSGNEESSQESMSGESSRSGFFRKNFSGFMSNLKKSQSDLLDSEYIKTKVKSGRERIFDKLKLVKEITINSTISDRAIWIMETSKDGKHLAVGGKDGKVRIWNINLGGGDDSWTLSDEPDKILSGHKSDILDISFSRSNSKNNFILSSSSDKTVRLWHVTRNECLCVFQHTDYVTSVDFHPKDDRFFLSGCLDSRLRVWNLQEKRVQYWNEIQAETGVTALITSVAFSSDGKLAICGSNSGSCVFYETDGLKYNTQVQIHRKGKSPEKISGLEIKMVNEEEKILVTTNDSRVRTYNMRDKGMSCKFTGLRNESSQIKASFSTDGEFVISGSEDGSVYIWRVNSYDTNERLFGVRRDRNSGFEKFKVSEVSVTCARFLPHSSNNIIVTSDFHGIIRIFKNFK